MSTWHMFDWVILALVAACIVIWPTQLISDHHNRWLRMAAISAIALQLLVEGPRLPMMPLYAIAALFTVLLVADRRVKAEPSAIRESQEGVLKKAVRWSLILGCAVCWLASVALALAS